MSGTMENQRNKRVVVLGGGLGSMATAFELSHSGQPWDITVYQMGWRLGGKGASGRNIEKNYRIEEHGVHMWSGLYDNAFRMMRQCYNELGRPEGAPLATWLDAFKPRNITVLMEKYNQQWYQWRLPLPTNKALPGEPPETFSPPWVYALKAAGLLLQWISEAQGAAGNGIGFGGTLQGWSGHWALAALRRQVEFLEKEAQSHQDYNARLKRQLQVLAGLAHKVLAEIWSYIQSTHQLSNPTVRRFWITMDFTYANMSGAIKDDVLGKGFNILNEVDYREWLGPNLVGDKPLTLDSPLAYFLYDAEFAYEGGDLEFPNLEAGNALRTLVRMAFTWKGAVLWQMQAGMGDVVFAPLYTVLKRRGVRFEFFHRVKEIQPSADGSSVERITLAVQALLVNPDAGYNPLINVKELPCWPSEPLWSQLVDGERLREDNADFESYASPEVAERVLERGKDFDAVVLGIPVAGLKYVASGLIQANPRWQDMVNKVGTVRTQALQLWLTRTTLGLGFEPSPAGLTLLSTYHASPLSTWADMTQVRDREVWNAEPGTENYPESIAYFCGPMLEDELNPESAVFDTSQRLLSEITPLWPDATAFKFLEFEGKLLPVSDFHWEMLVGDKADSRAVGPERLKTQYLRVNITPSERFTLSVKGSSKYRLAPGDSGFDNLVLAGDWTDNTFNIANVEATAMSGMLASNAISGYPRRGDIVGLDFGEPPTPSPSPRNWGVLFVLLGIASLALPAALTLRTVKQPGTLEILSSNPTPFGYTWSLLLFLIPSIPLVECPTSPWT